MKYEYQYEYTKFSNLDDEKLKKLQVLTLGPEKGEMWHWVQDYLGRDYFKPRLAKNDMIIAVCKNRNNNFVGWSVIDGDDIGVFVNPRYRNKGIGGKLSEMIASRTRNKEIICSPWSIAGLRLYTNLAAKAETKLFTIYNHRKIQDSIGEEILSEAKKHKNVVIF